MIYLLSLRANEVSEAISWILMCIDFYGIASSPACGGLLAMTNYIFMNNKMQKIVSLCKRRGFIFPGSEIYGGLANTWDYGPLGVELRNNIQELWWKIFVKHRQDMVGISSDILMNPKVWEKSGHLTGFSDPLVECEKCKKRFREDHLREQDGEQPLGCPAKSTLKGAPQKLQLKCPECKGALNEPKNFNLMFKTFIGPVENCDRNVVCRYLDT